MYREKMDAESILLSRIESEFKKPRKASAQKASTAGNAKKVSTAGNAKKARHINKSKITESNTNEPTANETAEPPTLQIPRIPKKRTKQLASKLAAASKLGTIPFESNMSVDSANSRGTAAWSVVSTPYRASPELPDSKGLDLWIDVRESEVFAHCAELRPMQELTDPFCPKITSMPLLLGDMELKNKNGTTALLFERKTIADLIASIKDGRYNEQSYRLHHASGIAAHNIMYIIEGSLSANKWKPPLLKMVKSALVSLQLFKGFSVVRTQNARETAEYIMDTASRVASKFVDGYTLFYPSKSEQPINEHSNEQNQDRKNNEQNETSDAIPNYATVVKACKKQNITSSNIHAIMLSQIPGISPQVADILLDGRTMEEFIKRLRDGDPWLHSLKISLAENKKPRQLSQSIIRDVYLYCVGAPSAA